MDCNRKKSLLAGDSKKEIYLIGFEEKTTGCFLGKLKQICSNMFKYLLCNDSTVVNYFGYK